jgi:hypothetical protein
MESSISRWLFSVRDRERERVLLGFFGKCWVREREREKGDKREIDSCRSQQIAELLKRRRSIEVWTPFIRWLPSKQ